MWNFLKGQRLTLSLLFYYFGQILHGLLARFCNQFLEVNMSLRQSSIVLLYNTVKGHSAFETKQLKMSQDMA